MKETKNIQDKIDSGKITKTELASILGITRVTLNTRLEKSNWKNTELFMLRKLI